jgi:hypothetical protein
MLTAYPLQGEKKVTHLKRTGRLKSARNHQSNYCSLRNSVQFHPYAHKPRSLCKGSLTRDFQFFLLKLNSNLILNLQGVHNLSPSVVGRYELYTGQNLERHPTPSRTLLASVAVRPTKPTHYHKLQRKHLQDLTL